MVARILRLGEVVQVTSLSRSTIWRLEIAGQFPRRIRLSTNRVGWHQQEVEDWVASRSQEDVWAHLPRYRERIKNDRSDKATEL